MNEKELIRQCQAGEKAAFDELIRMYYPYVSKYLLKLTGDETLTEDFVQETFLKMIRTIDQFDRNGKASFATYLIATAKNTWIDHVRRNRAVFSELSEADGQPDKSLEQQALSNIRYEEIVRYIHDLPQNQADAIRLKYIEEYTLKEIEEITGVPAKTVKSRIHEGTKKLRWLLRLQKEE